MLDPYISSILTAVISALFTLIGSLIINWWFEYNKEKKQNIQIIRKIFVALSTNIHSFLREKDALQNRIKVGLEDMTRSQWPLNPFDYSDYSKNISFLVNKSGEKILNGLYNTNIILLHIRELRNRDKFRKYNRAALDRIVEQKIFIEEFSNIYQHHIKYIDLYLLEARQVMNHLKEYAKKDLKISLLEFSFSEELLNLMPKNSEEKIK